MNPDELRALIEDAVQRAVQPLRDEIRALRLEFETLKNASETVARDAESTVPDGVSANAAGFEKPISGQPINPAPTSGPPSPSDVRLPEINTEIPAERTDFARFLQRGLEQEAHDYSEENLREEAPKKRGGWNPFKR